jgi:hypothetical protein
VFEFGAPNIDSRSPAMEDYIGEARRWSLLNPHGSVGWGWPIRPPKVVQGDAAVERLLVESATEIHAALADGVDPEVIPGLMGPLGRHARNVPTRAEDLGASVGLAHRWGL